MQKMAEDKVLKIGDREYKSRLLVGTGKYESFPIMEEALRESGAEIVTVALRGWTCRSGAKKT
jgi:thiazole synthase